MKLKLFSFMKSGKPVKASEESEKTDAPEVTKDAEDSEEDEDQEDDDQEDEEDEEKPVVDGDQSAHIAALTDGYNLIGAQVEKLTGKFSAQEKLIAGLTADRSAEVDVAAGKKAVSITASQGVPAKAVAGVSDVGASDAPTDRDEFLNQYNKISDPVKAGAFYAKYSVQFK